MFYRISEEEKIMDKRELGDEWKTTAYDLGGAFVGLGKTVLHSIKTGVDIAYDFVNEKDEKNHTKKKNNSQEK